MKIASLLRRAGSLVNPAPHPHDFGSGPHLRDYPVARVPRARPPRR
jgi:hypothetical protein